MTNTKTKNKNRAKGINKASRRAAHKKPTLKRVFCRAGILYHIDKEKQAERTKKAAKTPFHFITRVS